MDSDLDDISDEEYYNVIVGIPRIRRFHKRKEFASYDDADFFRRYRMSKTSACSVLEQIRPHIENKTTWNNALSAECMFLLTLRFYASGGFLLTAGDLTGVSTATTCRVIRKVSHQIALLRKYYITFPTTDQDRRTVAIDFFNIARFPRVIAAMDCTHVRIQSPGSANGELFRNRKGYFSVNVQTLCNARLQIMDIVARWPGSSHDSTIFNNSRIRSLFEHGKFGDYLIVADGGYQCRNYVMTPLRVCNNREEELYNESQIRTRNCVERSYGVWKRRFPVLASGLRLNMKTTQSIIVSTAILHNICCSNNEPEPPELHESLATLVAETNSVDSMSTANEINTSVRSILVTDYFRNLSNRSE